MSKVNQKMIIGFDASRSYDSQRTGTENYSWQIQQAIASQLVHADLRLYTRGGVGARGEGVHPIKLPVLYSQLGLASKTWLDSMDLLFVPAHVLPFLKNPMVPSVVVVHDIRTEFLPQHSNLIQKLYLNRYSEKIRSFLATKIIAVSESTKNDLVKELGVNPEKIEVVYEGVDLKRFSLGRSLEQDVIREIKDKYSISSNYLLFVSTVQPRKNISRLIEAYAGVKDQLGGVQLVVAGKRGWMSESIYTQPSKFGIENEVKFINYVDDEDLPYLYAGADGFVFPSLYEGFGLPVLESFASGVPVMTSDVSSLPEVGGDCAVYVDPLSVDSIKRGLIDLTTGDFNPSVLRAHAEKFRWEDTGRKTIEVFESVLQKDLH